jgi:uncharacterized damage-inducible protein DinB
MTTTAAPPRETTARPTAKQQFADVYGREHVTTVKCLRAFPANQASYRPHERSDSALQLAWRFVMENNLALAALKGPLQLTGSFPPPPDDFSQIVAAYEASARELKETLAGTPDSRLQETVKFFTGPKQMGDVPVGEVLWFILMDSVHHRGQLSVYLRCAGGKVPSIYGPSADEPWS